MISTSELLGYISGNYEAMTIEDEDVGPTNPAPDTNYTIEEAVENIRSLSASPYNSIDIGKFLDSTNLRLYSAPRINYMTIKRRDDSGEWVEVYGYQYAEQYPWVFPDQGVLNYPGSARLENARKEDLEGGDEIKLEIGFTSKLDREEGLTVVLAPVDGSSATNLYIPMIALNADLPLRDPLI